MNESVHRIDSSQRFERDQHGDSKGVAVFKVLHRPLILGTVLQEQQESSGGSWQQWFSRARD